MFGVPPFRAGVLDKANYANSRQQDEVYWYGTIDRFLYRIKSTINFDFLPKLGITDVRVEPKWETVKAMLDNMRDKADTATKFWQMGVPLDKINERLEMGFELEDVEGTDRPVWPGNMIPVDAFDEFTEQSNSPGQTTTEDDAQDDDDDDGDDGAKVVQIKSHSKTDAGEHRRAKKWERIIMQMVDIEGKFNKRLRSHFKSLADETLHNLNSLKGWSAYTAKEEFRRKQSLEEIIFDLQEAQDRLMKMSSPLYKEAMQRGGDNLLRELGLDVSFNIGNPVAQAKLAELTLKIRGVDLRLERQVRTVLLEGFNEGLPIEDIAANLTGKFDFAIKRSRTIARTETGTALNVSRNLGMRQAGIQMHEWLSSRDAAVRDAHASEDGNKVIVGTAFPVTRLLFPQDPSGPAEQVINCRCVAVPVVK
jgi:hypothetical protein